MQLHERIKRAMDSAELTQAELARQLGVSRSAVSQWLSSDIKNLRHKFLFGLARATGFNAEWIALEKGPMRPKPPIEHMTATEEKLLHLWRDMTPETKRRSMSALLLNRSLQRDDGLLAVAEPSVPYGDESLDDYTEIQSIADRIADEMGKDDEK